VGLRCEFAVVDLRVRLPDEPLLVAGILLAMVGGTRADVSPLPVLDVEADREPLEQRV